MFAMKLEKIWLTKGDNHWDYENGREVRADRMLILKIDGGVYFTDFYGTKREAIYWLRTNFADVLAAETSVNGKNLLWGLRFGGSGFVDQRVVQVSTHHDDLLNKPTFANAVRSPSGRLHWTVGELRAAFIQRVGV